MSTRMMETDYKWNVMVLCLEGGGVKGYSSLLMLQRLMATIAKLEQAASPPEGVNIRPEHWVAHKSSFDWRLPGSQESAFENVDIDEDQQDPHPTRSKSPSDPTTLRREMTKKHGKYLPCHYFDYIGGTSTGGLAAIMLGRLRLEVHECITRYQTMSKNIFGKPRISSLRGLLRPKYPSQSLVREIQSIVEGTLPLKDDHQRCRVLAAPDDLCKTVVFAALEDEPIAYLFRTYRNEECDGITPRNAGPPEYCQIWEAARATSAAPRYFKPMPIKQTRPVNGEPRTQETVYIDGAVTCNDPTPMLIDEIRTHRRWRPGHPGKSLGVKLVLTLGTGQKPKTKVKAAGKIAQHIQRFTRQLETHLLKPGWAEPIMSGYAKENDFVYFKWHGGLKVGAISLDDCEDRTFKNMEDWTREFMDRPEIMGQSEMESDGELWKVATQLVEERRKRLIRSTREWKRFASCEAYRCPLTKCDIEPKTFESRKEAEMHVEDHHSKLNPPELISLIEEVLPCLRGPWCHDIPMTSEQLTLSPDRN